jgi:MFS family permease
MSVVPLKRGLAKLGVALFLTYMSVALALPVISVFVTEELGLPNWMGGVAVGVAFLSTILSRKHAGHYADLINSKKCTRWGIILYMLAATICAASAISGLPVLLAFAVLIAGRLILGVGESMTMVGMPSWHFTLIGPRHSGKILSLMGMAMYGAFAVGGPVGLAVYNHWGFSALMLASFIMPVIGYAILHTSPEVHPDRHDGPRKSFFGIIGTIVRPGLVVCLQGVGFAVLGAFISLYFKSNGWPYAGIGLTLFGTGFVVSRILFGHLPDRTGGVKVALGSMVVETAGQCLLWLAPDYHYALAGALLTGLGCSMIFPSMGVEVIKLVAPNLRGTAFGAFAMFQDVAYAFAAPLAGVLADHSGYPAVFMFGFLAAASGLMTVLSMLARPRAA